MIYIFLWQKVMQYAEIKQVYLVNSDDVGKEWQSLDLCCNKVCIQLLVIKLVLPAKKQQKLYMKTI